MEPKLREIYGVDWTWWAIVAAQMEFPNHLSEQLVGLWGRYGEHAQLQGHEPDGRAFIVEFIEQNFPDVTR